MKQCQQTQSHNPQGVLLWQSSSTIQTLCLDFRATGKIPRQKSPILISWCPSAKINKAEKAFFPVVVFNKSKKLLLRCAQVQREDFSEVFQSQWRLHGILREVCEKKLMKRAVGEISRGQCSLCYPTPHLFLISYTLYCSEGVILN